MMRLVDEGDIMGSLWWQFFDLVRETDIRIWWQQYKWFRGIESNE